MAVETVSGYPIRTENLSASGNHTLHAKCISVTFQAKTAAGSVAFKSGGNNVLTLTVGIPYSFSGDYLKGLTVSIVVGGGGGVVEIVEFTTQSF